MDELGKTGFSFPQQPIPALKLRFLSLLEKLLSVELCTCIRGEESGRKRKTKSFFSLKHCRVEDFDFH